MRPYTHITTLLSSDLNKIKFILTCGISLFFKIQTLPFFLFLYLWKKVKHMHFSVSQFPEVTLFCVRFSYSRAWLQEKLSFAKNCNETNTLVTRLKPPACFFVFYLFYFIIVHSFFQLVLTCCWAGHRKCHVVAVMSCTTNVLVLIRFIIIEEAVHTTWSGTILHVWLA